MESTASKFTAHTRNLKEVILPSFISCRLCGDGALPRLERVAAINVARSRFVSGHRFSDAKSSINRTPSGARLNECQCLEIT
jgi:hypothetical protein